MLAEDTLELLGMWIAVGLGRERECEYDEQHLGKISK
jgi:hypothetical protein